MEKISIIGSGGYGEYIKQTLTNQPVETTVVDAQDESFNMADLESDHIIIATPNFTHFELAQGALNAGKQVLCEKPLALTRKEVDELYGFAKSKNAHLGVGFVLQNHPFYALIRAAQEKYGPIQLIRIHNHATEGTLKPEWYWNKEQSGGWFMVAEIHWYHLFAWLTGTQSLNVQRAMEEVANNRTVATDSVVLTDTSQKMEIDHCLDMTHDTAWAKIEILFTDKKIVIDDWVPRYMIVPEDFDASSLPSDFVRDANKITDQRDRDPIYQSLILANVDRLLKNEPNSEVLPIVLAHQASEDAQKLSDKEARI
jgi:predicted dehydrogenase